MELVEKFYKQFCEYLENHALIGDPQNLYDPANYILGIGGKRFRPIAAMLGSHVFNPMNDDALIVAHALEMFHNFSLVHDDIMDEADKRRSKEATHIKYGIPTAILAGDVMLVEVFRILQKLKDQSVSLSLQKIMADNAKLVCEGQQMDMNFETQTEVPITDYITMIKYKTAVLLGAAFKMGAIINQATEKDAQLIYKYGMNLGIAFQIDDDILDSFGDPATFGKKVGGDIIQKKKTILYLLALEKEKETLLDLYTKELRQESTDVINEHIAKVKAIFIETDALASSKTLAKEFSDKALDCVKELDLDKKAKAELYQFHELVLKRSY